MAVLIVWKTLLLVVVVAAISFWFGGWYFGHFGPIATYRIKIVGKDELNLTYAEFAALLLSAVSILVTILGISLAVLAFWGYAQLNKEARKAATKHVKGELRDGALKTEVEQMIVKHIEIGIEGDSKLRKALEDAVDRLILTGAEARSKKEDKVNENTDYGE